MPNYKLTRAAEADINAISRYTLSQWSEEQALLYVDGLLNAIQSLSHFHGLGQACPQIHPDYRRLAQGKHWIYYMAGNPDAASILVVRILHQTANQAW